MAKTIGFGAAILALVAAGYLYFANRDFQLRISEAQIQQKLADKLPHSKTYLGIFRLTLDNPRVKLLADSGRIRAGLDLQLASELGGREPLSGSVDLSGRLRYVADESQFYLADVKIEQLQLHGLADKQQRQARLAISAALGEYLSHHPIYRLKPGDFKQAAARLVVKDVRVSGDTLVVTMGL